MFLRVLTLTRCHLITRRCLVLAVAACLAGLIRQGLAENPPVDQRRRAIEGRLWSRQVSKGRGALRIPIDVSSIPTMRVSRYRGLIEFIEAGNVAGGFLPPDCSLGKLPLTSSHTDANFEGGSYYLQAGFAEDEIAAVSYVLDPEEFPIQIKAIECIFAQFKTVVPTVTHWSVLIWDGTPSTGIEVARFSSDDILFPHLRMPVGTAATNIRFEIDEGDPDQIFILNDSGTNTFSVGFRVDQHNNQTFDPCLIPPPVHENAFPTTDVSGLLRPNGNWLSAINCGALGCRPGWSRFAQLGACQPSGDWVIRATYCAQERVVNGACCHPDATCVETLTNIDCIAQGSMFMGEDSQCADVTCPDPVGACCLFGICLSDEAPSRCAEIGGTFAGGSVSCDPDPCISSACCMPDGSCQDLIQVSCAQAGGIYEGGTTSCKRFECPQPVGSCCINGFCIEDEPQEVCEAVGVWNGPGSDCWVDWCAPDFCPAGTVQNASPPSGIVDARQPYPPDDDSLGARQGIGGSQEPITVTLDVPLAEAHCFAVCETVEDPALGFNTIENVLEGPANAYEIRLVRPITPGAVTTIEYDGGTYIEYISHPANVNGDLFADRLDMLALIDFLNGVTTVPYGLYSVDIDHSGEADALDVLRIVDLLEGVGLYDPPWAQTQRPTNTSCP